jgi:hypothetical protein
LVILIALITISFQSVKAAIANPVKSLRAEWTRLTDAVNIPATVTKNWLALRCLVAADQSIYNQVLPFIVF